MNILLHFNIFYYTLCPTYFNSLGLSINTSMPTQNVFTSYLKMDVTVLWATVFKCDIDLFLFFSPQIY